MILNGMAIQMRTTILHNAVCEKTNTKICAFNEYSNQA